jgi:glutathione S-transferase
MTTSTITLYSDAFWISPWVFTAFVALREKGIAFEVKELKLHADETKRPDYASATMTARVPAICDDGFWLAESIAIVEYLDESRPNAPRLWPAKTHDRARARQLSSWIRSIDTWPIAEERPTHTMFYERAKEPLSDKANLAVQKLFAVADRFVRAGSPNLFDAWCITDAELAFIVERLILNGHDVPAKLREYATAQWKRPSVAEWVSHARIPYVPYL